MKVKLGLFLGAIYLVGCSSIDVKKSADIECINHGVDNAFYVGLYKGADDKLTNQDLHQDYYCAEGFIKKYPSKFLTIFGLSRIQSKNSHENTSIAAANDAIYQQTYEFSKEWAKKHGEKYPILTGAGPGLMEAAAIGAIDGNGISIGYTTYYKTTDPKKAFWVPTQGAYAGKQIITDGLIFTSVSARETAMILHSAAAVFVPGGGGTNWEIFQMLEMLKSDQLTDIPVYFLGNDMHWKVYEQYIMDMVNRGVIKDSDKKRFLQRVTDSKELMKSLEQSEKLFPFGGI